MMLKSMTLLAAGFLSLSAAAWAEDAPKPAKQTEQKAKQTDPKEAKPAESKPAKPVEVKPAGVAEAAGGVTLPDYRDDRSTPQALIESYYNAVNRKEYVRAYSYYAEGSREPDFKAFVKGFEHTKAVRVAVRKTEPDPGAGQIYWSAPVAIEAETDDGKKEVFSGCYTIRMTQPGMQEAPPFKPMELMSGSLTKSPLEFEKSVPEDCEGP